MTAEPERIALYAHRFGFGEATGVDRYASELARAMTASIDPLRRTIEAVSPRIGVGSGDVATRRLVAPRRLLQASWAVMRKPKIERFIGPCTLVHVLVPTVPVPTHAPLVVTVHDLLPVHQSSWYTRKELWLFDRATAYASTHASRIITPSAVVAADVVRTLGVPSDRVRVVPEGVSAQFVSSDASASRTVLAKYGLQRGGYLICVGAINERKNIDALLEVLAAEPTLPPLVLVGPRTRFTPALERRIQALGVEERVTLTGFVPDADLNVLVTEAFALVHPSLFEGFGLTPLEAMAVGTPVVAARAGAVPEVLGDAALLADPHEPSEWRTALVQLAEDRQLRTRMSEAGKTRARQFTWERAAELTLATYDEVLADGDAFRSSVV